MRSVSRSPSMSSWMFAGRPLPEHSENNGKHNAVNPDTDFLKITKEDGVLQH